MMASLPGAGAAGVSDIINCIEGLDIHK